MISEERCKQEMKKNLSIYRYFHSENVANVAKKLAKAYHADEEKAYITGLLHDITKEFNRRQQREFFERHNIKLDFIQSSTPKLWHSISGAEYVKIVLNEHDEEIYNAIRYHTTARENMSLLEKIIYVSDFVSEERDYEGVDKIRNVLDRQGLEACVLEGLAFSVKDLSEGCKYIHRDTFNAYNQAVRNFRERKEN